MFEYLTAEDWENIATNYEYAFNHMLRLENLREMEYLQRACRGKLATPWQYARLAELESILGG